MHKVSMVNSQHLAQALMNVQKVISQRDDIHILHTSDFERPDREILLKFGWIQEIVKGWYLLTRPDLQVGDSSVWYGSFWDFLYIYLNYYFEEDYCLSAEHSIDLHVNKTVIPKQVIVVAKKGRGAPLELPFQTSLFVYSSRDRPFFEKTTKNHLQIMSLPYALCKASPFFFEHHSREAEIALQLIKNPGDLLQVILKHNFVRAAGRLLGAYRFLKNEKMISALESGLYAANLKFQESNPFKVSKPALEGNSYSSPYVARIKGMWKSYREVVLKHFSSPPSLPKNKEKYLNSIDEKYSQDAYHSLSIEGYQVNEKLIEKVKNSHWSPDQNEEGKKLTNTLAARGYYEAFEAMKYSLLDVLKGKNPGAVIEQDLSKWFLALFNPNVKAGLINQADLYGYRRFQVYIRNSRHTPLPPHALNEAMDAFFQCLSNEEHPAVRAILGHFIFVYIHPYMDGNGRVGRLLMNVMLASGGYPWTIVHLEDRTQYLNALEKASTEENITPFVKFIKSML